MQYLVIETNNEYVTIEKSYVKRSNLDLVNVFRTEFPAYWNEVKESYDMTDEELLADFDHDEIVYSEGRYFNWFNEEGQIFVFIKCLPNGIEFK